MILFLGFCAFICLCAMLSDKLQPANSNFTYGFIVCIIAIVVTTIL